MISKFTDSPDDKDMMFRKVRDGIEIGIAPMMYGYNIKAGILGDNTYWIDYSFCWHRPERGRGLILYHH